jgi:hypothetical protein
MTNMKQNLPGRGYNKHACVQEDRLPRTDGTRTVTGANHLPPIRFMMSHNNSQKCEDAQQHVTNWCSLRTTEVLTLMPRHQKKSIKPPCEFLTFKFLWHLFNILYLPNITYDFTAQNIVTMKVSCNDMQCGCITYFQPYVKSTAYGTSALWLHVGSYGKVARSSYGKILVKSK